MAAGGRHADTEEVHSEDRQAEGAASKGARAHVGGLGGLSGADHQMPARERPEQGVVCVGSSSESAVAAFLVLRTPDAFCASLGG